VGLLAEASDDDAVAGVQFRVDGEDLGEADTAPPYGLSWDSTRVANGRHVLSAVARDRAGNRTTSEDVAVITSNRPASTRFASGHRVQTAVRFLIRGGPSLANERLGPQPAGALGVVVDGPDFADGSWWWKVDFDDGTDGWAAEDWLEPVPRPQ
jgi:hypothetical protein